MESDADQIPVGYKVLAMAAQEGGAAVARAAVHTKQEWRRIGPAPCF